MGTSYGGYHEITGEMVSALTAEQERHLYEDLARKYRKQMLYMARRKNFELSAELRWNRNHAPTPAHLLQLKKPILPERWRGPREGWIQWSELLINPGITIKGMPDLQGEPLTAQMIYDAIQKLGENWRTK